MQLVLLFSSAVNLFASYSNVITYSHYSNPVPVRIRKYGDSIVFLRYAFFAEILIPIVSNNEMNTIHQKTKGTFLTVQTTNGTHI